ncbi:MAG: hypothetical protein R2762_08340 [Bryobacteraceae bacterium]
MRVRTLVLLIAALPALSASWDRKAAADYLDGRQREWFAWAPANRQGTPCLSCHTGLPYVIARPALRRALSETGPTTFETGLRDGLQARLDRDRHPAPKDAHAAEAIGVESVMAALLLPKPEAAFERLWLLQWREGPGKGSWPWFALDLDPWETEDAAFFGASLAALAVGEAPRAIRATAAAREGIAALTAYLRGAEAAQPLHNRLALLWASTKLPAVMPRKARRALLAEVARVQQPDGGWSIGSLGPFSVHAAAPEPARGSDSYATAFTAFVLQRSGIGSNDRVLARALSWLAGHQDPATGAWPAPSMNKRYEPGSNQIRFMQDAATGYAVAALLESGR